MATVPWDVLIELIDRFPDGASLEQIMLGLNPSVPRRTLQRWLSTLIKEGKLIAIGNARARRYKVVQISHQKAAKTISLIPISREGESIQSEVSKPIQARHPVSYHREFLEKYKPNVSHYLSESLRRKLFKMGSWPDSKYPAGTYAKEIFNRLLIDLSWNSSRLEGNTYSLLETERLLEQGKAAEGKDLKETQMILNHKSAIEFLIFSAEQTGINRYTILNLHTLLSDNLLSDSAACGRLRAIPVGIGKSVYLPCAIPQVVEECFNAILEKANAIEDPFEQAFFLMVHLPYLQAFEDVNKRTSRLAANIPLIRKNLCPLSFIDVPEEVYINALLGVYELNRIELLRDLFVWAYERSCALYSRAQKTLGEPDPFRMKYRTAIQQAVKEVVCQRMGKEGAVIAIRKASQALPSNEKARFIEIVERELQSLHEGNIARYQLRPSEYVTWKENWK